MIISLRYFYFFEFNLIFNKNTIVNETMKFKEFLES